jgi:Tfp pilus assembly protein PilO
MFQGGKVTVRISIPKDLILFLIAIVIFGLGYTYYLESLGFPTEISENQESNLQQAIERMESSEVREAEIFEVFKSQSELVDSMNNMIQQTISFQKTFGWVILTFLTWHLLSLIRYEKKVRQNET